MLLIVPAEGEFESFEAALTSEKIDDIVAATRQRSVLVYLPKFSFDTEYDLMTMLWAMGMKDAFGHGANFSGMDGTDDGAPWINFVAHKAFISVDEFGTLAAAGTAAGFTIGILPTIDLRRPFIFAIRDNATGTILFLGRVLDPS